MKDVVDGGCFCGAVRLSMRLPPRAVFHCHCSMCRRLHGAAFATWVVVGEDALVVAADTPLASFPSSEHAVRERCARCGSPLLYRNTDATGLVLVARAALPSDDDALAPESHVHWADHASWLARFDALPKHGAVHGGSGDALEDLAATAAEVEADALFQRGNAAMNGRRYADAIAAYDAAEEKGFKRFPLYANRGFIHVQEGRHAAALLDVNRALELEPGNLRQRAIGAYVLACLDRPAESTAMIDDVLRKDPTDASTLVWTVQALRTLGDDRALPLLELLKDKPGLSAADLRNVRAMLADVALESGQAHEALAGYLAAEREGVAHWTLYSNRARARLELDDTAGAELDIRRALADKPELPKLRALLALILAKSGRHDDGRREVESVLAGPRDAWTDYTCARALDALGDRARADEILDELRRRPGLPRALLRRLLDS